MSGSIRILFSLRPAERAHSAGDPGAALTEVSAEHLYANQLITAAGLPSQQGTPLLLYFKHRFYGIVSRAWAEL